ncbi:MAG: rhomboid family intramembrane serine protease [bacterium]
MNPKLMWLKFKTEFKVIYFLMGLNVLMFLISIGLSSFSRTNFDGILYLLGADNLMALLSGWELFRPVTSAFLHGNLLHLLLNMWALWSIGRMVENFYGSKKFFLVYIFTAITASLMSNLASLVGIFLHGNDAALSLSVGASGAIFGLVGLILGSKYRKNPYGVSMDMYVDTYQLWIFVGYNILIGFGVNFLGSASFAINNWAHIGGFLGGLLFGVLLDPVNTFYTANWRKYFEKILFWVSIITFLASFAGLGFSILQFIISA